MYTYRIYNLNTNKTFEVKSIKDFAREIKLDVELDRADNWFFNNLKNMKKADYDYTENDNKRTLLFHYEDYIIIRDTPTEVIDNLVIENIELKNQL